MPSTNDITKDIIIKFRDDLWQVAEFQHVSPGKGAAFVRTRLKNVGTGKALEQTFKDGEAVDIVDVERRRMQYLYGDPTGHTFMDGTNFEQVTVPAAMLADRIGYIKEGQEITVLLYEGRPVAVDLPKKITLTVVEAPPGIRGDTAGGKVTKEVVLDTGLKVRTPLFINEGDAIVVNTESGDYVERA